MISAGDSQVANRYSEGDVGGYNPQPVELEGADGQRIIVPVRVIIKDANNFQVRRGMTRVIPSAGPTRKLPVGGTVVGGIQFSFSVAFSHPAGTAFNLLLINQTSYATVLGNRFTFDNGHGVITGASSAGPGVSQIFMNLVVPSTDPWVLKLDGVTYLSYPIFNNDCNVTVSASPGG